MVLGLEKFNQGMTPEEYIDRIKVNREPFIDIYNTVKVPVDVMAAVDSLSEPLNLAVFTADWCGDALSTTSVILRLAREVSTLNVRVFNRDEELELTNSFLPEDRAGTVPVFVVFDQNMREVARFIETAEELVPAIDSMDDLISQQVSGGDRGAIRGRRTAYRVERAQSWGEVILKAFVRLILEGVAEYPTMRPHAVVGGTKWPR